MEMIGKYKVLGILGKGATGAVYLADDPFNNRKVAIKVMFPDMLKDAEDGAVYKSMFLNEASLAGKIFHPHIVSIYDAVVEDDMSYIVMELVEGGTLEKFCTPQSLLPEKDVAEIIFKCVRALSYANAEGLIHRDVKPGNILHRTGTEIKIADFGAAVSVVSTRTIATTIASPLYMSPELVTGARASMRTDIYSLGVVMYYMLSGHPPFAASNPMSMSYQIVNHEPEPPSAHSPGISAPMEDLVKRAMAKDAEKRYQTWDEFGKDLTALFMQQRTSQFSVAHATPASAPAPAATPEIVAPPPKPAPVAAVVASAAAAPAAVNSAPLPQPMRLDTSSLQVESAPSFDSPIAPAPAVGKEREVSDTERFTRLKTLSFFHDFPENELWEVLRISKWRLFPAGEVLIKEGDSGDSFFILVQGNVKVTRGKKLLNVLGTGDCIGEMSYLTKANGARSATISTASDCILMKIRAQELNSATPTCRQLFDRQFLVTLVQRLEMANEQLAMT